MENLEDETGETGTDWLKKKTYIRKIYEKFFG